MLTCIMKKSTKPFKKSRQAGLPEDISPGFSEILNRNTKKLDETLKGLMGLRWDIMSTCNSRISVSAVVRHSIPLRLFPMK